MVISRNAEGVHGQRKVGNPRTRPLFSLLLLEINAIAVFFQLTAKTCH